MGKIASYQTFDAGRQLQDFTDEVSELLNYGKVAFPVVTSVPTWKTYEGEVALYNASAMTDRRIYVRLSSSWILFAEVFGTPTQTSKVFFTTSSFHVSSNSTTENELIRAIVGSTSLFANILSEGRTIRLQAWGYYNSPATPGTMIMNVRFGGATILSTSNQTVTGSASTFGWNLESFITCQTTGGAGTIFGQGRFDNNSSATAMNRWQMVGSSTVTFNTTGANIVELTCQWGTANAASQLFCTNAVGELLN